jgi:hypothetical protein
VRGTSTKRANRKFRGTREGWGSATGEISGWVSWCLFFGSVSFGHPKEMNAVGRHMPQAFKINFYTTKYLYIFNYSLNSSY